MTEFDKISPENEEFLEKLSVYQSYHKHNKDFLNSYFEENPVSNLHAEYLKDRRRYASIYEVFSNFNDYIKDNYLSRIRLFNLLYKYKVSFSIILVCCIIGTSYIIFRDTNPVVNEPKTGPIEVFLTIVETPPTPKEVIFNQILKSLKDNNIDSTSSYLINLMQLQKEETNDFIINSLNLENYEKELLTDYIVLMDIQHVDFTNQIQKYMKFLNKVEKYRLEGKNMKKFSFFNSYIYFFLSIHYYQIDKFNESCNCINESYSWNMKKQYIGGFKEYLCNPDVLSKSVK